MVLQQSEQKITIIQLNTIIQFRMQSSNNKTSGIDFTWQEREGLEKIFYRIQDLSQIQDESQNQLSPAFFEDQSEIKSRKSSQASLRRQQTRTKYSPVSDNEFRQSNIKLHQDNVKLFAECVRLRKICQQQQNSSRNFSKKTEGIELLAKIDRLEHRNQQLELKVENLQHELQVCSARQINKSNQSGSVNSTHESGKGDPEKDRMIKNMKIVHESEIRKMKHVIDGLREELGKVVGKQSGSFSTQIRTDRK